MHVCLSFQGCRSCAEGTGGNHRVLSYPEHLEEQGGTKHCTLGREYLHVGGKGNGKCARVCVIQREG